MVIQRFLIATALSSVAIAASAASLSISNTTATGVTPASPFDVVVPGFTAVDGSIGRLDFVGSPAWVQYTFLGGEAAAANTFANTGGGTSMFNATNSTAGSTSVQSANAGALDFIFSSSRGGSVANGGATSGEPTFAIFSGKGSGFQYIVAFDDGGKHGDRDFDDMVFGVNAVPEPQTYALMLAGLGAVGFVARRRPR